MNPIALIIWSSRRRSRRAIADESLKGNQKLSKVSTLVVRLNPKVSSIRPRLLAGYSFANSFP